jgi:hypothetical protein
MFNSVFCKPGTGVVSIEGSPAFTYGHFNLFAASQLDFGFIFGKQDRTNLTRRPCTKGGLSAFQRRCATLMLSFDSSLAICD